MFHKQGGNDFLKGAEGLIWNSDDTNEFLCLKRATSENDVFTRFIKSVMSLFFHRLIGQRLPNQYAIDVEAGISSYDEDTLEGTSNLIAVAISSIMPVLTIFALNALNTTNARLGLTVMFTAVFAGLLVLFSTASRAEVFGATSA